MMNKEFVKHYIEDRFKNYFWGVIQPKIYNKRKMIAKSKNCFLPDLWCDYIFAQNTPSSIEEIFDNDFDYNALTKKLLSEHTYFDLFSQLILCDVVVVEVEDEEIDIQIKMIESILEEIMDCADCDKDDDLYDEDYK